MRYQLKGSIIFPAIFIAIAIITSTVCSGFLQLWASVTIIVVSIIVYAVAVSLYISKRQHVIEKNFSDISSSICDAIKRIEEIELQNKKDITEFVSKAQDSIDNRLSSMSAQEEERSKKTEESLNLAIQNIANELIKINECIEKHQKEIEGNKQIIIEKIDGLFQQGTNLNETMKSSSELICSKASALSEDVVVATNGIKLLSNVYDERLSNVIERLENLANAESNMKSAINDYIQLFETRTSELQYTVQTVSQDASNKIEAGLSEGITTIKTAITDTTPLILAELENVMNKCLEIKEEMLRVDCDNQKDVLSGISSSTESIIVRLSKIEDSYSGLFSLINEDNEEYDKAAEEFVKAIHVQYSSLHENVHSLISTARDIEGKISELNTSQNAAEIISSINSAISELSSEMKNAVVNINRNVVESQLAQSEITKDEIIKLQILLRTLLNKGQVKDTGPNYLSSENPNRTETIYDDESGNTVLNHYNNNLLVKSEMKNKRGVVIYELFYRDGVISQSKSYDESGTLKIEQSYYDNGQVHFREEFRKDGKYSSEFERNGNKK